MHTKLYERYLRSPAWKRLRGKILERDPVCLYCLAEASAEVHHLHYRRFTKEIEQDLIGVCSVCHCVADSDRKRQAVCNDIIFRFSRPQLVLNDPPTIVARPWMVVFPMHVSEAGGVYRLGQWCSDDSFARFQMLIPGELAENERLQRNSEFGKLAIRWAAIAGAAATDAQAGCGLQAENMGCLWVMNDAESLRHAQNGGISNAVNREWYGKRLLVTESQDRCTVTWADRKAS